jgi:hypothetical protein
MPDVFLIPASSYFLTTAVDSHGINSSLALFISNPHSISLGQQMGVAYYFG